MQRLGKEQWSELINEYKKSGLTQKEFAARHEISIATLQFWLYKLRPEADQSQRFLSVTVVASAPKARHSTSGWVEAVAHSGCDSALKLVADSRYLADPFTDWRAIA